MSRVQLNLISCGREFHRSRAAIEKARLPLDFKLKRGLTKRFLEEAPQIATGLVVNLVNVVDLVFYLSA